MEGAKIQPALPQPASPQPVSPQPAGSQQQGNPTIADILTAIKVCNDAVQSCTDTLTSKIDYLATDISLIRHDMDKFRSCMTETEDRISQLEDSTRADSREVHALQIQVKALQDKAIDTENRMRRNNLRILGLPERAEGAKPAEFAESFLIRVLDLPAMPSTFVVERAHRVPFTPPPPGGSPRPFLLRLLNYRDRDRILMAARNKQDIYFHDAKILIFPDYSPEVQQRRRSYTEVRKRLRSKGLKFSLLYPSKLRVVDGDRTRFFDTPAAAASWLDGL